MNDMPIDDDKTGTWFYKCALKRTAEQVFVFRVNYDENTVGVTPPSGNEVTCSLQRARDTWANLIDLGYERVE